MILGQRSIGPATTVFAADLMRVNEGVLARVQHLVRLVAFLDGAGDVGVQLVRPVLFRSSGPLVATGPPVEILGGAPGRWVAFEFDEPGQELAADTYYFGLHPGPSGGVTRGYIVDTPGMTRRNYTDAFADGPPPTLPALTSSTANKQFSFFLETLDPWVPPDVEDAQLARLPWDAAQRALGVAGAVRASRRTATASWHGVDTDPERGAFCIARSDGPLADLVGERLKVCYRIGTRCRSVAVYCHDEQDFPDGLTEDLSLSRRAFLALAPLALETVPVTVEVLA